MTLRVGSFLSIPLLSYYTTDDPAACPLSIYSFSSPKSFIYLSGSNLYGSTYSTSDVGTYIVYVAVNNIQNSKTDYVTVRVEYTCTLD
jgi:hypothetical protein